MANVDVHGRCAVVEGRCGHGQSWPCRLHGLACEISTALVSAAPMTALEVLLGLPPLHFVVESNASACRLSGMSMCLDRGPDIGSGRIYTRLMETDRL
jgi:hypothetical protein